MVSVIIPVYNTELYLEKCISSVVNQTYQDLEIIIINDGSTDSSSIICKKWEKIDARIRYIEKENEGQGIARNLGVNLATGEYVIFVDSDDYLDLTLIDCVYEYIIEQKADICVYGYSYVDKEGEIYRAPLLFKTLNGSNLKGNKKILGSMTPFLWNKMFSSCLIKSKDFGMSNYICEDLIFNVQLYKKAKKICMLDKPLYFYRYNRSGNISTNYERYLEIECSIHELNQIFAKSGEFEEFWIQLYELSITLFKDILLKISKRTDMGVPLEIKNKYLDFWKEYKDCLERWFSQYIDIGLQEKKYLLVGSYNLRVLIHCFLLDEGLLKEDYGYSSIISLMSKDAGKKIFLDKYSFQNLYKKKCVEQDIGKYFYCHAEVRDMDYIVMDLLDEVADVIKLGEDCYITESIFLKEINYLGLQDYERIPFLSKERRELFKKYLHCFAEKIRDTGVQVVMVKHFMCERHSLYYDVSTNYNNLKEIQEINQELEWYYQYFTVCFPETIIVDDSDFPELFFTYDDFPFGCEPFYYNSEYYQRMAIQLNRCIYGNRLNS